MRTCSPAGWSRPHPTATRFILGRHPVDLTYVTAEGSPPVSVPTTEVRAQQEHSWPPTTQLLTQLLRTAGRVAGEQSRQLRRLGLSPSAFTVLQELAATSPEGMQPCDLARGWRSAVRRCAG